MNEVENVSAESDAIQQADSITSLSQPDGLVPGDDPASIDEPDATVSSPSTDEMAVQRIAADELQARINERFDELCQVLDEANRISQDRERIIDRLHQENQQLRSGELQQAMMPFLRDLIRLHDDLLLTAHRYLDQKAEAGQDFESFSEAAADILYRYGVERYIAVEGTPFNPKEHRALAAIPTEEAALDRTIARVVRAGFRIETRVLRPLETEVYRAQAVEQTLDQKGG
jgi:molecular chaperone GrpE (heat shock protein)